jgi:cytoskeletal protein CcmA (bactofilin family)
VSNTLHTKGNLDVSGNVTIDGTLDVSNTLHTKGDLDVSGAVTVDGTLDVSNTLHTKGNLDVSGAVTVDGAVTAGSFSGSGANLTGLQSSNLDNSSISIDGSDYYLGGVGYTNPWGPGGGDISYSGGNVEITGGSNTLTVAGDLTASSDLSVGGDVGISGDLEVDGGLTLGEGDVEMKGGAYTGALVSPTYAWEFRNGTAGATVYDMVGGVAATPSGATSTSEGMVFSANDDIVNVGAIAFTSNAITIETYAYNGSVPNWGELIHIGNEDLAIEQYGDSPNNLIFQSTPGGDTQTLGVNTTSTPLSSSKWLHVVCIVSSGTAYIYLDGTLSNSTSGNTFTGGSFSVTIGCSPARNDHRWDGTIAYTRIWDGTVLSATDVAALYARRDTLTTPQLDFHVNSQLSLAVTENGLALPQYDVEMKGYATAASVSPTYAWEFRNATGAATVYDMVGGVAATPQSGATSTSAGMTFNGSSDYVDITPFQMGGNNFSIELYVEMLDHTEFASQIFSAINGTGGETDRIMICNGESGYAGNLQFAIGGSSYDDWTGYFSATSGFVHIVITMNGSSATAYKNGVKESRVETLQATTLTNARTYYLGKSVNSALHTDHYMFNGTIAYFRIWQGTALTDSDAATLYADRERVFNGPPQLDFHVNSQLSLAITENGLALPQYDVEVKGKYTAASVEPTYAWEFRNATGAATVYDMVGGVAATPSGVGVTSTSAGMIFDTSDNYATLGDIVLGGGAVTIEIYFNQYSSTTSNFNWLYHFTSSSAVSIGAMGLQIGDGSTSDRTRFFGINSGGSVGTGVDITSVVLNEWTHLVIVLHPSNNGIIYYNNTSTSYSFFAPSAQTVTLGKLGGFVASNVAGFNGAISHFRIWDGTALSASDVARLYAHRNAIGPGLQIHSNNELALGITQNTLSMPRYNLVMEAKNNVGVAISTQPTYAWEFRDATGNAVVNDWVSGVAATPGTGVVSTGEGIRPVVSGTVAGVDITGASLTGGASDEATFEIYFKKDAETNDTRLIVIGGFTNLYLDDDGTNHIHPNFSSTKFNNANDTTIVPTNDYHIIITVHSDNSIVMYVNGYAQTTSASIGTALSSSTGTITLGYDSGYFPLDGPIAYFRIYDGTALSASDVATLYAHRESKAVGYGFNVCGKSALTVAPSAAEVAGSLSVGSLSVGGTTKSSEYHLNDNMYIITGGTHGMGLKIESYDHFNFATGAQSGVDSGTSRIYVRTSGQVGIGETIPTYPLHVNGSSNISTGAAKYFSSSANLTSISSGTSSISIYANTMMLASQGFISNSDERIKKNIVDLSDNEALETLRLIQPKKYEYVDKISRGNKVVYGYIAQQIQEVLPYAVGEISDTVPNIYNLADISSEVIYTEASDISAVSIVGISTLYVDVSNVNTSAEVSMNVVMVEQSDISQNAVFSESELEDGTKVHKLTFNNGYNTSSLHESSNILRVTDASNQEYHITITNIETSYRVEIDEDLSGLVNAQGELFVAGQQVPQNVYKLLFAAFDTATLDASSTTLKLVDASDVTQYVSIASVLDSSTLQIDDDLQYMVLDSSNQLFVYGQNVSKSLTSLTFDGSYNVSDISENMVSLKVLDTNGQPHAVKVYSKESDSNRLLLDEDISGKISYSASGELFVQGQKIQSTKHILTIQNYDTANLDASSTTLCIYDYDDAKHEVSIVSVIDGSNIEISEDPTSFAHEGQVFVYGQKVDDFHTLSKEHINVVTLSAVQELDRALTKVTQEKDDLQTKYDALETTCGALETKYDALQTEVTDLKALLTTNGVI